MCDIDNVYILVGNNPTICIPQVPNCEYYQINDNQYTCTGCRKGGALVGDGSCDLCDEGYEGTSSNLLICEVVISNCEVYSYTSNSRKCERCSEGFKLSGLGLCDERYDGYVPVIRDTLRCYESIPHCKNII
jgi:hypothetical protein